jgi:CubicO group peptidase (beta-lactamase class C family)
MMRTTRARKGALAGTLLTLMAATAPAQAPADTATLTATQSAAVKRLKEVIEVMNTGDYATIRAYIEANSVHTVAYNPPNQKTYPWEKQALSQVLAQYRRTRGVDLVRISTETRGNPVRSDIVGIVRNRLTGDEEFLAVAVEPQPPHRITWLPLLPPAVVASLGLKRAPVPVAVTDQQRLEEIASFMKRLADADAFSGGVIVARDGKPVFAQAYGYADREKKVPNTLDTPFLMGSLTKTFTSLAIGQLVERGKLSYEDPLSKFLPEFPDAESAKRIRIKHLLSHTAGLAREGSMLFDSIAIDRQTTLKAMVEGFERKPLAFEPGTSWSYSNIGYVLLGRVIEVVTGEDYYDYMQKNVFGPGGAKTASFPMFPKNRVAVVPMAYPYDYRWDEEAAQWNIENLLGKHGRRGSSAGSSVVSANDLLRLSNAMRAGQIVTPETYRLHSSAKPELGSKNYGFGFIDGPYLGGPFIGHNGRSWGQCTDYGDPKDTPWTIIVFSNVHSLQRSICADVAARILRVLRPT